MNLADFHFIRPFWLLSLLPYAALVMLTVNRRLSRGNWSAVCDEALLPYLLQDKAVSQSRWPLATGAIAALFAIFALAGPTWERLPTPVFRNDSALAIILDLSRSMDAADITPSRLSRARFKIADILRQRKDGQTALIAYAGDAFTVSPLTNDTDTIENQLPALTTDIMPVDGNNVGKALAKAESLFKQAGLQRGQILLITDGGNTGEAISEAKSLRNYPLLVLGVGTPDGAPIALAAGGFLKDDNGGIVVDKLDSDSLEKLAKAGNGMFHPLSSDDADIRNLMSAINLQNRESGEKNENLLLDQWSDKGPWLLLLVLPLAAMSFRKGLLCLLLAVLMPIPKQGFAADMSEVWRDLWQTKDQQAQEAYVQGQYDRAAELFENPDWKAAAHYKSGAYEKALENLSNKKSADSIYNQGNALAKTGKLKEALESYNQSLKLNPDDEDAKFNKDLVEKALEKQQETSSQDQSQDQQNKEKNSQSKNGNQSQQNQDGNKSDPSTSENDQQQKEEQQSSGQKPESKPEQSQQSTENQPDKPDKDDRQSQDQSGDNAAQAKPESQNEQQTDDNKDAQTAQPVDEMSKEEQQAHEQWLKRIPDDPGGLLRRKFQYQYEQRERH